jgi:hypothetical protein
MASIFAGAALQELYSFQNSFKQISSSNQALFSSSIVIIGEARLTSSTGINIWVKNIGQTSFGISGDAAGNNATYWDLFITFPDGTYQRFAYNPNCNSNCWTVQILNGAGIWQNGETIQITVYTASPSEPTLSSGSYQVTLTLPNGASAQDKFSL